MVITGAELAKRVDSYMLVGTISETEGLEEDYIAGALQLGKVEEADAIAHLIPRILTDSELHLGHDAAITQGREFDALRAKVYLQVREQERQPRVEHKVTGPLLVLNSPIVDKPDGDNEENDNLNGKFGDELEGILANANLPESPLDRLSNLAGSISHEGTRKHEDAALLLLYRKRTDGPRGISGPLRGWINPVGDYQYGQRLAESQVTRENLEEKPSYQLSGQEKRMLDNLRTSRLDPEKTVRNYIKDSREAREVADRIRSGYRIILPIRTPETEQSEDLPSFLSERQPSPEPQPYRAYLLHSDGSETPLGSYLESMEKRRMLQTPVRNLKQIPEEAVTYARELNLNWWASGFMTGVGYAESMLQNGHGDKAVEAYHALGILEHRTTLGKLEIAVKDPQNSVKIGSAMQNLGYGKA